MDMPSCMTGGSLMKRTGATGRGFTLVELLVVVAIISLLVSVLMPALSRARYMTRTAVCLTQHRTFGAALNQYSFENNGLWPANCDVSGSLNKEVDEEIGWYKSDKMWWCVLLNEKHIETAELLWCPQWRGDSFEQTREAVLEQFGLEIGGELQKPYVPRSMMWGTINAFRVQQAGSTSWPAHLYDNGRGKVYPGFDPNWAHAFQMDRYVNQPSDEIWLADSGNTGEAETYQQRIEKMPNPFSDPERCFDNNFGYQGGLMVVEDDKTGRWRGLSLRHGKRTNVMYIDGHAQTLGGEKLYGTRSGDPDCIWDGYYHAKD